MRVNVHMQCFVSGVSMRMQCLRVVSACACTGVLACERACKRHDLRCRLWHYTWHAAAEHNLPSWVADVAIPGRASVWNEEHTAGHAMHAATCREGLRPWPSLGMPVPAQASPMMAKAAAVACSPRCRLPTPWLPGMILLSVHASICWRDCLSNHPSVNLSDCCTREAC
eukprot:357121-Chlamydomonas_euryale.AAC.2